MDKYINITKKINKKIAALQDVKTAREAMEAGFVAAMEEATATGGKLAGIKAKQAAKNAAEEAFVAACNNENKLKKELAILKNNARVAYAFEVLPVALSIISKYAGKRCGEATYNKIKDAAREAGFSLYFDNNSTISIRNTASNGYDWIRLSLHHTKEGEPRYFLIDNVLQDVAGYNWSDFFSHDIAAYVENIPQHIKKTEAAYKKVRELSEQLSKACSDYNTLAGYGKIKAFEEVSYFIPRGVYNDFLKYNA